MNASHLNKLYDYLNAFCFKGKLKKIKVQFKPIVRKDNAIGFFEWWGDKAYRIVIDNRIKYVPAHFVLVHEMLHQYQYQNGRAKMHKRKMHTDEFKAKLKAIHKKLGWQPPPTWSMRG